MGNAASVISPALQEINQFVLSEMYKDKVSDNNRLWIGLANMACKSDEGRSDSKNVKILLPKNPDRNTIEVMGLKFFTRGDEKENKIVDYFMDGAIDYLHDRPHEEMIHHFKDEEDASQAVEACFEGVLPPHEVKWSDWDSLRTQSQFAFNGLGQYFLTNVRKGREGVTVPEAAVYEIDLSHLAKYEVREDLERYGAISYYGADRLPVGTWWCEKQQLVLPTDKEYGHVAMLFRVSLATRITLREHLSEVHWTVSNGLLLASERHLRTEHPIRRLIKPHTYGAADVNESSAKVLAPYKGLAWRTFGFTKESWPLVMADQVAAYNYHTLEEHFVASELPDEMKNSLPLYRDGLELYKIFEKYVRTYVDIFYDSDENVRHDGELNAYWKDYAEQIPGNVINLPELSKETLIKQLTYSFFHVTAFHQYVGANIEYLKSPNAMSGALSKNSDAATIQQSFYVLVLMALTQMKQPNLINDWTHLHEYLEQANKPHYEKVIDAINTWQKELVDFAAVVDQRNTDRENKGDQIFVAMNPRIMDCSVSV